MSNVNARKHKQIIPTYVPKKANDLPMFFENKPYQGASGRLYPIPYSDGITDEKKDVEYDVFTLENEYIKTQVLPAIGGKILNGYDKVGNHDFIYNNEVIKPALVGLAGAWISGGIEFNWPQHHRPTTYMPLEAVIEENADGGKTVWTGEVEPFNRMKGMAGITLDKGRSYIKAKIRVYNRTAFPQIFMWWANLAVPVNDDMPFEYNIEKNNLTDGYILKAFALLGFDKKAEAVEAIEEARKLNPYDFRIFAFDRVIN